MIRVMRFTAGSSPKGFIFVLSVLYLLAAPTTASNPAIYERFESLRDWDDLVFDDIDQLTDYTIVQEDGTSLLHIESIDGGSGIIHTESFNVYENPIIEWRWRVEDIISSGDLRTRDGDTYPVRIYVNFEYDPDEVGFGTRLRYEAIRAIYGEYPPLGSILYIWSNRTWPMDWYENQFTSRAMMLPIDQGRDNLMEWREHERNIVEDYRQAFGEDPPSTAKLAIMGDSYGSGETSRAWIDWVRVRPE